MTTADANDRGQCAWCRGPLPPRNDVLEVVRPSDGATIPTCSPTCLGELLSRREPIRHNQSMPHDPERWPE